MIKIIKVTGQSLTPEIQEGDFVVLITNPFFFDSIKQGDIVVFQHETYGRMIKRVVAVDSDGRHLSVVGNHPHSVDSRRFGPIDKKSLSGKVIWHIPKPRG